MNEMILEDELKLYLIAVKNLPYQISTERPLNLFSIPTISWPPEPLQYTFALQLNYLFFYFFYFRSLIFKMSGVRFAEDADPAGLELDQNQGSKSTSIILLK